MNIELTKIIDQIRQSITAKIDPNAVHSIDRFFKEGETAKTYGVKSNDVRNIAKTAFQQIKDYPKQEIFEMCEEFWKSGYMEEIVVACVWTELLVKQFEPEDFTVFERWLSQYVNNWAACDTLCNHTIGEFVMKYPNFITQLIEWAKSPNRWVKRGAAVTLIIPARKGLFLNEIIEIANILLLDPDDMVQKGYGWMLKAASMSETFVKGNDEVKQKHLETVYDFVIQNRAVMPRTALRYAIEKMPETMKIEAMKK